MALIHVTRLSNSPMFNKSLIAGAWAARRYEPTAICGHCGCNTKQAAGIGLEPTLGEWVDNIVAVGREVWRVLRDDGIFFLNLGDAYAGSGKGS